VDQVTAAKNSGRGQGICAAGGEALGLWNVQVRLFGEDSYLETLPTFCATVEARPFRAALRMM